MAISRFSTIQIFIHSTTDGIAKPKIIPTGDNARWVCVLHIGRSEPDAAPKTTAHRQ